MSLSSRTIFVAGFLICLSMLLIAGYFQFVAHYEPCPLCILQRVSILLIAIVFLVAALHNPNKMGVRIYGGFIFLFSLIGGATSSWHVRLQNLPADQVPSCGPGLNFMLDNFPLTDAIAMVFRGSGECAEVLWTLLGLSIPAWTLVAFIMMAITGLILVIRKEW
jgi:disulfide bond formation protein DsbB